MVYITSRKGLLTIRNGSFADPLEMDRFDWFSLWQRRFWPYNKLREGDVVYWFDSKIEKIVWKTEVLNIKRSHYSDKQDILDRYPGNMPEGYYDGSPKEGYFFGYKVKVLEKLNLDRPIGLKLLRNGWLGVDNEIASSWFGRPQTEDTNTLDESISDERKSLSEILVELNEKMQGVSPERIEKIVSTTIRKDTKIINALKLATDYKCQFPDCTQQILKKNGELYIEVAHIKAVSVGGQSILGNLLVLCPNHHKEFDLGDLKISEQKPAKLVGQLNGKNFLIEITNHS